MFGQKERFSGKMEGKVISLSLSLSLTQSKLSNKCLPTLWFCWLFFFIIGSCLFLLCVKWLTYPSVLLSFMARVLSCLGHGKVEFIQWESKFFISCLNWLSKWYWMVGFFGFLKWKWLVFWNLIFPKPSLLNTKKKMIEFLNFFF